MRKVVFAINITADGYCSHTDMIADDELHVYFTRLLRNADVILSGRVTHQLMVPYWPDVAKNQSENEATNEFARVFDLLDKDDELFFVEFATSARITQDWTTDRKAIRRAVANVVPVGGTAMYDAIADALPVAAIGQHRKKAL